MKQDFNTAGPSGGQRIPLSGDSGPPIVELDDRTTKKPDVSGVLSSSVPRWKAFPTDALPPVCRRFVSEQAKAAGVDASYIGVPMLGVLAGAIGNARSLKVKRSYSEPSVLWAAVVSVVTLFDGDGVTHSEGRAPPRGRSGF